MITIAPGFTLADDAGASFLRMVRDGCPTGGLTSAYRDPAFQIRLFRSNYTADYAHSAKFDRRRWQGVYYWRRVGGVMVGIPGTSRHEIGEAVDCKLDTWSWIRSNGDAYGWSFDVAGDTVHADYYVERDIKPHPIVTPTSPWKENEMRDLIVACYSQILGRGAAESEINGWLITAATNGWSPAQIVQAFRDAAGGGAK